MGSRVAGGRIFARRAAGGCDPAACVQAQPGLACGGQADLCPASSRGLRPRGLRPGSAWRAGGSLPGEQPEAATPRLASRLSLAGGRIFARRAAGGCDSATRAQTQSGWARVRRAAHSQSRKCPWARVWRAGGSLHSEQPEAAIPRLASRLSLAGGRIFARRAAGGCAPRLASRLSLGRWIGGTTFHRHKKVNAARKELIADENSIIHRRKRFQRRRRDSGRPENHDDARCVRHDGHHGSDGPEHHGRARHSGGFPGIPCAGRSTPCSRTFARTRSRSAWFPPRRL